MNLFFLFFEASRRTSRSLSSVEFNHHFSQKSGTVQTCLAVVVAVLQLPPKRKKNPFKMMRQKRRVVEAETNKLNVTNGTTSAHVVASTVGIGSSF